MSMYSSGGFLSTLTNISRRDLAGKLGVGVIGFAAGRPLYTLASAQRLDPDQEAIACVKKGNTQCAVDVFENEYSARPFDDGTRENLFAAHLVNAMRSIDTGKLTIAMKSYNRAKHLIPADPRITYVGDALSFFDQTIVTYSMDSRIFQEVDQTNFESRYVVIEGLLGENATAYAMTAKEPGAFNWFSV